MHWSRPMAKYLVVYNVAKQNNIRDLCCTAAAHEFEVLCVGGSSIECITSFFYISLVVKPNYSLRSRMVS